MLERLTLVVPSYKRPKFLSRIVSFYSAIPVNLLIIDGTDGDPLFDCIELPSAGSIRYFHMPGKSLIERMDFASLFIKTPFVAWLGDDEFQLPSGVLKSIEILEEHPDVASAIGLCAGFKVDNNKLLWGNHYNYGPAVYEGSIAERIEQYFFHYSPTMPYSVLRTSDYLEISKILLKRPWSSSGIGEFIFSICSLVTGRHVIHDHLQWLRSSENPPEQAQLNRNLTIAQWLGTDSYSDERSDLNASLVKFIRTRINGSTREAGACIALAFSAHSYFASNKQLLVRLGLTSSRSPDCVHELDSYSFKNALSPDAVFSVPELADIANAILASYD